MLITWVVKGLSFFLWIKKPRHQGKPIKNKAEVDQDLRSPESTIVLTLLCGPVLPSEWLFDVGIFTTQFTDEETESWGDQVTDKCLIGSSGLSPPGAVFVAIL